MNTKDSQFVSLIRTSEDGAVMEAWSSERLKFDNLNSQQLAYRSSLRATLQKMPIRSRTIVHGVYQSADKSKCDAENILFFNVGATAFGISAQHGLSFERIFTKPRIPDKIGTCNDGHFVRYEIRDPAAKWCGWSKPKTGDLANIEISWDRDAILLSPSWWWHQLHNTENCTLHALNYAGSFSLSIILEVPAGFMPRPINLIKPLFDGVISAFQCHNGKDLEPCAERLGKQLSVSQNEIASQLIRQDRMVLGKIRLLWLRGKSVQWNPADDRCVCGKLVYREDHDTPPRALIQLSKVMEQPTDQYPVGE